MTEQERPRTEAGRSIIGGDFRGNEAYTITREGILAIEAEARQQAVREIDELAAEHRFCNPAKYEGCYSHWPTPHCRADGMAWPCDVDRIRGMAGLNASESPPTSIDADWQETVDRYASESGQPRCGEAEAGRAVQDDGLDVERLAEAIRRTALDHYRPEASSSYAHRVAKHYIALRTAPPFHDPQEPER